MKVLILVLSANMHPYNQVREAQEQTWDSVDVDGVQTLYYFSHPFRSYLYGKHLHLHCPGEYMMMHWRLKLALDYVWDMEWDYIFRTSQSSYVNKAELLKKAETLPKENCYCGIQCCGGSIASGNGFFISRDVADILRKQIPIDMGEPYGVHPDDVLIGRILEGNGINVTPGADRMDYYHPEREYCNPNATHYHYRCKRDGIQYDFHDEIYAMIELHNKLNQ